MGNEYLHRLINTYVNSNPYKLYRFVVTLFILDVSKMISYVF